MEEIWKDIPGFEGLYQVSNMGRVKSFCKSEKMGKPDEYILNPTDAENGYANVTLYKSNVRKKFLVHRLVAQAFLPNPNNLPQINHKDENRFNNRVDNLEWCTAKYNNHYGTARIRVSITKGQKICQYLLTGEWIATYASLSIASELTGVPKHSISDCLAGHSLSGRNYVWKYDV